MDFSVYASSLCLKENADPQNLGEMTFKIILYAAVEIGMMSQGKAENPLTQPVTVHCGKGNRGKERMEKFMGKLGQTTDLSGCLRWTPHHNAKKHWRKYFEWAWVKSVTFFTGGEETSDKTA